MPKALGYALVLSSLSAPGSAQDAAVDAELGLRVSEDGAFDGLTLMSPIASKTVFILDMAGEIVHRWDTDCATAGGMYLQDDGSLLRLGFVKDNPRFKGPGVGGGRLQRISWDGEVVWEFVLSDEERLMHHDVEWLPNGNVLVIVWEYVTRGDVIQFGRDADQVTAAGLWVDSVLEVRPTLPEGGEVVWEWHAMDHLVQDRDRSLFGFGSIPDLPGRIDINVDHRDQPPMTLEEIRKREELEKKMRALGYGGGDEDEDDEEEAEPNRGHAPDWLHTNGIDYLAEHDLIVISCPHLSELFVIDHSTTTEEAASSSGGRWGRGGDLLWRWGNPRNFGAGHRSDQRLFYQHDPRWLDVETSGELRLTFFNNGGGRPGGDHSSVDEIVLPFDPKGGFGRETGEAFGPAELAWTYSAPGEFFSPFISGTHRLPNGNTLVTSGVPGRIFEVTHAGDVVWDYRNPHEGDRIDVPNAPPPRALFRATRLAPGHPGLAKLAR